MLICDSHEFVFIHIHRTGGTSITAMCKSVLPQSRQLFSQHTHAGSVSFDVDSLAGYKTYAFVRNPWDRLYSWYSLFAKYNPRKEQKSFSFEEFLYNYPEIEKSYGLDQEFRFNQLDCLRDQNGEFVTSFVGRYESFEQDAVRMFRNIGINEAPVSWLNSTDHNHYQTHYSDEAREFVAEHCAADIDCWNYQFDDGAREIRKSGTKLIQVD